jgi:signal transduction histidine kinase
LADPELLRGKTDFDVFTEEHARPAYEDEQQIIRTGQPILGKVEKETHADGRVTWAMTSKLAWRDEAGNIIGTFGISDNITSIKAAEAKLEALHRQLVDASRQAGMAEVATSVLHNVGNVLNSINVAATLVDERVRKSRVADLNRLVKLLSDHSGDLGAFLTADPRGQKVPEFLGQLADRLAAEQALVLTELASLRKNVEHIKEIVAMQQSYAKVSGVIERIEIAELAEDTLRMNAAAFARHDVRVVREYSPVPPINTDKHKVLQILINLVRNAKYACDESGRSDKQVTVRVNNGDDRVRISVIDNGVGIPPENLTRIFHHGFTTRKDGHGFGLHSGALAAKELGGTLTAQSDGPGKGATFALELPKNLPHAPNASEAHSQP